MEEENSKKRNIRPAEKSNLPFITLLVLVGMVLALLYVGYEYIADDTSGADEFTNIIPDTTNNLKTVESTDVINEIPEQEVTTEPVEEVASTKKEEEKPAPKRVELGGVEITHTVRPGQTFLGIANRYNLKMETLKSLNPEIKDITKDLKSDVTKLKVKVKAVHTVGPGDVLRVVSGKYNVSKQLIMDANGKTQDIAERGEKLIIPFPDKK
jgi:LysM repeat protein